MEHAISYQEWPTRETITLITHLLLIYKYISSKKPDCRKNFITRHQGIINKARRNIFSSVQTTFLMNTRASDIALLQRSGPITENKTNVINTTGVVIMIAQKIVYKI